MNMHERRAMTIDEAIRRRRSVRGFRPDEVPETTLRRCSSLRNGRRQTVTYNHGRRMSYPAKR